MKFHGGTKPPKMSSAPQNTATGTKARPGAKSAHHIHSSAPHHPHKLDSRHTPGALK